MEFNSIALILLLLLQAAMLILFLMRFRGGSESQKESLEQLDRNLSRLESFMRDELFKNREEASNIARDNRNELSQSLRQNEERLEKIRATVESQLSSIREESTGNLEKIRATVDEKLHATLETRLGESFRIVSERLEQVQRGLGEMHTLAAGVGDLKKVLSNVKSRGVLGEYQLETLLSQILTQEQYGRNVQVNPDRRDIVEYAIKLPGPDDGGGRPVWMPIDAKFPTEDYQRLLEAYDTGDSSSIEAAQKQLAVRIKSCAADISGKYLIPPATTDFGILFLPFEGLYAEVLRIAGLFETIHRDYHVTITGPTTMSALLNSLQMGFRTLAIEKRSSEVWQVLGAVKTEFGKFENILARTKKKLQEAGNVIEDAETRTRAISRKLRSIEELPADSSAKLLDFPSEEEADH